MKTIYIIFESDNSRSLSSFVVKLMSGNKDLTLKHYHSIKSSYEGDEDYFLTLAEYEPNFNASDDANVFRELTIIKTTEND